MKYLLTRDNLEKFLSSLIIPYTATFDLALQQSNHEQGVHTQIRLLGSFETDADKMQMETAAVATS